MRVQRALNERYYPNLEKAIWEGGIKKKTIAKTLGISEKTLSNKLTGRSTFEWEQCFQIKSTFFPNSDMETLFKSKTD